jgi:hypothetical protein
MVGATQAGTLDKPTTYVLSSAERGQIVNWINSASEAQLTGARLSASNIKRILAQQALGGYSNWDQMWVTPLGSNGNMKLVMIQLEMYQNPYDRRATRPPVRIRPQDRAAVINWFNTSSYSAQVAAKLSLGCRDNKIPLWRSQGGFQNWKHLLAVISEGDIMKGAVYVGSARFVSGSTAIEMIQGISTTTGNKFRAMGINSSQQLLYSCVWPEWRQELADKLGQYVYLGTVTFWARRADLNRISGIGGQYGEILEASGVKSIPDLVGKNPDTLRATMLEVNARRNLVQQVPTVTSIRGWITKAATLPKMLEGTL